MRYLLDTNIVSALLKDPAGPIGRRVRGIDEGAICTSIIVMAEIKYGIKKSGSQRLAKQFEQIAASLSVEPCVAEPADDRYAIVGMGLKARA